VSTLKLKAVASTGAKSKPVREGWGPLRKGVKLKVPKTELGLGLGLGLALTLTLTLTLTLILTLTLTLTPTLTLTLTITKVPKTEFGVHTGG